MRGQRWIRDDSGLIAAYVSDRTWQSDYGLSCIAYGLFSDASDLLGGVVLHDFDGVTVFFSIALEDGVRLGRDDLDHIQSICFDSLGAHRMATRTPKSNERALRLARLAGLTQEGVEREAGPGSDDVVRFALLSSERRRWSRPSRRQEPQEE